MILWWKIGGMDFFVGALTFTWEAYLILLEEYVVTMFILQKKHVLEISVSL